MTVDMATEDSHHRERFLHVSTLFHVDSFIEELFDLGLCLFLFEDDVIEVGYVALITVEENLNVLS